MGRRKGEDTTAAKRRRMPFAAKIKREDPFRPEDERDIAAACRRVAAASECYGPFNTRTSLCASMCRQQPKATRRQSLRQAMEVGSARKPRSSDCAALRALAQAVGAATLPCVRQGDRWRRLPTESHWPGAQPRRQALCPMFVSRALQAAMASLQVPLARYRPHPVWTGSRRPACKGRLATQ